MFVRAMIKEGVKADALLVPQRAVTRNPRGEPVAMIVGEGNRVEARVLKADRVVGDNWLVTGGINAGDRVIVEGLQKIGPGAEVKPAEMPAKPEPTPAQK